MPIPATQSVQTGTQRHSLRLACAEDAAFVFQLFVERHAARFELLGWDDAQLQPILQMQHRARAKGYADRFAGLESFIVCDAGEQRIGELLLHRSDREVRIVDISVAATQRRQGIATEILLGLQRQAAAEGKVMTLSVDHGNPARRLYERLGFQQTSSDALQAGMQWRFTGVDASQVGRAGVQVNLDA